MLVKVNSYLLLFFVIRSYSLGKSLSVEIAKFYEDTQTYCTDSPLTHIKLFNFINLYLKPQPLRLVLST